MQTVKSYKTKIYQLMYYFMDRVRGFELEELAMLKIGFVSFGIIIGVMFSGLFKKLSPIVKILFFLGNVFLIWHLFFSCEQE